MSMFIFGLLILSVSEEGSQETNNCNCWFIPVFLLFSYSFDIFGVLINRWAYVYEDISPCPIISFTGNTFIISFSMKTCFIKCCFPRLLFSYSYLVYISPYFYFPPDWVFLSSSLLWNILMDSVFEFNQNSELSYIIFV